jgi:micrococcal nuclease
MTVRKIVLILIQVVMVLLLTCPIPLLLCALENATVVRIVDGDTINVRYQGQDASVRLIGIDTPESRANKKANKDAMRSGQDVKKITAMGKKATAYVKSIVAPGDNVFIEFDVQKQDRYGRLLAYVYLAGGQMLNEEIIRGGYASVMTVPPNVMYQHRFIKAYKEARENRRGFWE